MSLHRIQVDQWWEVRSRGVPVGAARYTSKEEARADARTYGPACRVVRVTRYRLYRTQVAPVMRTLDGLVYVWR